MSAHLAEEEQLDRLKEWWKKNGNSIIAGIALGLSIVVGYNWWQNHKINTAENASLLYDRVISMYADGDVDGAIGAGNEILDKFDSTPYAGQAALYLAKIAVEQEDLAAAEQNLRWVLDNGKDSAAVHIARLRLAMVLIAGDKLDEAVSLLNVEDQSAFASQYQELIGDIHAARDEWEAAHSAYQQALDKILPESGYRDVLTNKLNDANGRRAKT